LARPKKLLKASKAPGYFARKKQEQRDRDKSAGVCLIRRKGCLGETEPGKTRCRFCADFEDAKTAQKRAAERTPGLGFAPNAITRT
jgi:hypothetical protein